MKLRTRLCIAFCILIFIPLLLTGMAAFGVYRTQSYAFEQAKDVLVDIGFSVLLILIFTAALMTVWIYRAIIDPIRKLEKAAQEIRDGNLDFEIEVKGNDESNISHDLKTPITAIKGYVEGIMDGVADTPEKMEKYVRTIYNKTNEMDLLINELTIYSKIDTNRIPYNFSKINVAEYFEDCVEEIGMDLDSKGIGLSYINYAEDDIVVIMDPEQIRRVIHNIISNSVKYLDKQNGFINIRVRDVGDFVQFEFEDNGRGIAAKDLPYIFERFYRAEKSRNSATGGSGIGLSIVKKIIEDHGGKIWATSKESSGTTMYFVIRKYQEVPNEQNIDH